ncbi:hypothetical protein Pcinc_025744, partial [Petrolisthes cinctipes]
KTYSQPSNQPTLLTMSTYQAPSPGWFDEFRTAPFPTLYPELKTSVTQDVLYVGWGVAFLSAFTAFCLILPGVERSLKEQVKVFLRVTTFLAVGLIIMLCNFGQEWEVGHIETRTAYKAGSAEEIHAAIGVKLGLRSVNITLKALEEPEGNLRGEKIDYNERFSWEWAQGRAGFGPFAGNIQREFRAAQFRGTPLPILWIAEYFTFDGEGIRFGRHYRTAGWYAHMCVWLTFPLWILMIVLYKLRIDYAALTTTLTGGLLVVAAIIWASKRNFIELVVPFNDAELTTKFGIHWYLSLVLGVLCILVGLVLYGLHQCGFHDELCQFFGNNPLQILHQETLMDSEETSAKPTNEIEMEAVDGSNNPPPANAPKKPVTLLRSRGTTKRFNKKVSSPSYAPPQIPRPRPPPPRTHLAPGTSSSPPANQATAGYQQQQQQQEQGYMDQQAYNNQAYQQDYNTQQGYLTTPGGVGGGYYDYSGNYVQDYSVQGYDDYSGYPYPQQDYSGQGYTQQQQQQQQQDYSAQGYATQNPIQEEEELYDAVTAAEPPPPRPPKK